ncbi:hypothetical protein Tsubulata_026809 [Turnera subulata]|uniref:1-phosphatidylinositol-4-phosphate 5-kinase n=1 Tax=Turnera subulata TaxID=218843 RepID=A0A9Q0F3S0_9ROSI|nr:hypothetical protein Tsubulata_026809 [Turnera subulata]
MAPSKEKFTKTASKDIQIRRAPGSSKDSTNNIGNHFVTYEWKDYCPEVFRSIREFGDIDDTSYILSICSEEVLSKIFSSGKPGRIIPVFNDDRFVVRTLQKSRAKHLLDLLPSYYVHLQKNPATLLSITYGLHMVKEAGGHKVYFAVHSNIIPLEANAFKVYDLKGSKQGRKPSQRVFDEKILLKDLDFDFRFYLDPLVRERVLAQIRYDCELLESKGMMDYSFLIGISMRDSSRGFETQFSCEKNVSPRKSVDNSRLMSASSYAFDDSFSPRGSIENESAFHNRSSISSSLQEIENIELTFGDNLRTSDSNNNLGMEMPARAVRINMGTELPFLGSKRKEEGYEVRLYFGIVDIYQSYSVAKRIGKCYKSLKYDSKSISAVNPKLYSSRFQNFLKEMFLPEES